MYLIYVFGAKIWIEERTGYLYAFVSGPEDSTAVSIRCAKEICQEAKARGKRRILIEEDFPNALPTTEVFDICIELAKVFPRETVIAHVDRNTEQHDTNVFGAAVAYNRGLMSQAFSSIKDAEEWLTKGTTE